MSMGLTENNLIKLIEESDQRVRNNNKKYFYRTNDYKLDNVFLSIWYEQKFGTFNNFESPDQINEIKLVLEDKKIDLTYNYNIDFLKKLRNDNSYLQLMFSGGADSVSLLTDCIEHDIYIDEIISVYTGDSIDLDENTEIKKSAIPYAEKYKGKYGKFTLHQTDRNFLKNFYKDPYILLKTPEFGGHIPFVRQSYQSLGAAPGKRIVGADKPQLLHYKNKWYTVCFDTSFNGHSYIDQLVKTAYEPANIKALIRDSIVYRNYLVENNNIEFRDVQFFSPSSADPGASHNRRDLEFFKKGLKKLKSDTIWCEKDVYALTDTIQSNDLEFFILYSRCLNNLVDLFPTFDFKKLSHGKFCWVIDIDSLEIYSQQDLIPNGFEK